MKFSNKRKQYEASNVTFNALKCEAYSYAWWKFVALIGGKIVFNNYNYSPSTVKHQYKVRRLMADLGIKIDLEIEAPMGLQQLDVAISHHQSKIDNLKALIAKPKMQKAKNLERYTEIGLHATKIQTLNSLIRKVA